MTSEAFAPFAQRLPTRVTYTYTTANACIYFYFFAWVRVRRSIYITFRGNIYPSFLSVLKMRLRHSSGKLFLSSKRRTMRIALWRPTLFRATENVHVYFFLVSSRPKNCVSIVRHRLTRKLSYNPSYRIYIHIPAASLC